MGKQDRWIITAVLQRTDGLPGDSYPSGKLFLTDSSLIPQLFDPILHGIPLIQNVKDPLHLHYTPIARFVKCALHPALVKKCTSSMDGGGAFFLMLYRFSYAPDR